MKKNPMSVSMFLMDGSADERIKCTIANRTIIGYKIPMLSVEKCKNIDDLKKNFVYLLFGEDEESVRTVYVGQASERKSGKSIIQRLQEHKNERKIYWSNAIVLTSMENSFQDTEISYLESKFIEIIKELRAYKLLNRQTPFVKSIDEKKLCELNEYIELAVNIVVRILGYDIFTPPTGDLISVSQSQNNIVQISNHEHPILYLESKIRGGGVIAASGRYANNGDFVVLKGSKIEASEGTYNNRTVEKRRVDAFEKNIKDGVLQSDELFNSPSAAATFVTGRSSSGNEKWKTKEDIKK